MAYDPVKAHEYYVKYRKKGLKKGRKKGDSDSKSSKKSKKKTSLVGLSNSGLNDAGKMQYALVKDRLTSEMNEELDGVTDKDEIQKIREKYQQKALNEVTKLKNDSKYKQEKKTSSKSTAKTTTKSTGATKSTTSTASKSTSSKASSKSSGKSNKKSGSKAKSSSSSSSSASSSALEAERAAAERKLATINRLKTEVQTLQQRVRDIISSGQISPENKGKAQTAINEVLSKLRELSAAAR